MRSATVAIAFLLPAQAIAAGGQMVDRFAQDFHAQYAPQAMALLGGETPQRFCRIDSSGLRCTIPTGGERVSFCGISAKFVVKGDFEITGDYKILKLPKPEKGHGAGVKISIKDHRQEWASLQRLHLPNGSQVYSAHRAVMHDDVYEHSSKIAPTSAMTGRLRLKRAGTTIHYLVADGEARKLQELRAADFTEGDLVQVYFAAQTGDSPTLVDVVWTDISLQAEGLVPTYQEVTKSRHGWQLATLGLAILPRPFSQQMLAFRRWSAPRPPVHSK